MVAQTLTRGELNRALLARQHLLERVQLSPIEAIEHLVGLQAQSPNDPYFALWSRLQQFERDDLISLLEQRQVIKAGLMRCTLHLMSARDFLHFRLALQPALRQILKPFFENGTMGFNNDQFSEMVRAYVREQPRTGVELRAKFGEFFPGINTTMMGEGIVSQIPLVHVYPGGVWNMHPRPAYTDATTWVDGSFSPAEVGIRDLILRYLAAFGPATVRDMQIWSRLPRLRPIVEMLRSELRTFRDEQGRELFDVHDAPLPPANTPAPVRFLPEYDNLFLSHHDRSRIGSDEFRADVMLDNSGMHAFLFVNGYMCGRWGIKRAKDVSLMMIEPFVSLSPHERNAIQEEGERLMHFARKGTERIEIQLLPKR